MSKATIRNKLFNPSVLLLSSVIAIFVSMSLGLTLIALIGIDPMLCLRCFYLGAIGSLNGFAETISKFVPIIFCGMGCMVGFKSGFANIGNEGQFAIGGLGAVLIGAYIQPVSPILHMFIMLLVGIAFGALWSIFAGFLRLRFKANELLTTMMLNYVATYLLGFLYEKVLKDPAGIINQTRIIHEDVRLPILIKGTRLHIGLIIALVMIVFVDYFMNKTPYGFSMKIRGAGDKVAVYAGINKGKTLMLVFFLGGALSGLGGAVELMGTQHRMIAGFSAGYGIDGIGASIMGRNNVYGVALSALLFAVLRVGAGAMQRGSGVPSPVLSIIQGIVIVTVIISSFIADKIIMKKRGSVVYE